MSESQQLRSVGAIYAAYENGERQVVEHLLADGYEFFSPPDPGIGRERYFELCWPLHEKIAKTEVYFGWDL